MWIYKVRNVYGINLKFMGVFEERQVGNGEWEVVYLYKVFIVYDKIF